MIDIERSKAKSFYSKKYYKGKSLLEWATIWFKTSNDGFHAMYGFNFNPHEYMHLYEVAREEVYGKIRIEI